jgi:hypothetical protein
MFLGGLLGFGIIIIIISRVVVVVVVVVVVGVKTWLPTIYHAA